MIEFQLFVWTVLSLIGGMTTYFILTEGKSRFLFVLSMVFSAAIGMATSYIWVLTTKGLELYSWTLFILPETIAMVAILALLSYYKAYHPKEAFPRIPKFSVGRTSGVTALLIVFVLSIMIAASYLPSTAPTPSISMLGSGSHVLSEDDVANTSQSIDAIKSADITIQKSVVSLFSFREDPKVGEYLDFKIEFKPSFAYLNPSLKIYVADANGNLISSSDITTIDSNPNMVQGQIYCEEPGAYTITAVSYDLDRSKTTPIASNVLSYTVSDAQGGLLGLTNSSDIACFWLLMFFVVMCLGMIFFGLWWKNTH